MSAAAAAAVDAACPRTLIFTFTRLQNRAKTCNLCNLLNIFIVLDDQRANLFEYPFLCKSCDFLLHLKRNLAETGKKKLQLIKGKKAIVVRVA